MKFTKKCDSTQDKISINNKLRNRRRSSAGMFYTSSAGAVTSLILIATLSFLSSAFLNLTGLNGTNQAHATASTITISITDSVALDITSISTTGTFATSDTSTNNIRVSTNNGTGYTLGIKASTEGSNALIKSGGGSIPSHTVTAGIDENTYRTSSTYNNTWGYRPSKLNSSANSKYFPGPTSASTAITLDKTTSANPSTANNYNLAIGTRVNSSTAPGAYSNTFILTVVANPSIYSITYNQNTTDTVTDMPSNVVNQETSSETVNISTLVPERDGFNFTGWCTVQTADGADTSACTSAGGATYNPDGGGTALTWTIDQTSSSNSLNLYAMWKVGKIYIQDLTLADCPTTPTEVYDKRDESSYKIAKLADNNCWMLDNLALNPVTLTYDQLNGTGGDAGKMTNATSTTLSYLKYGGGSSPYTAYSVANAAKTDYYNRPRINAGYIDTVPSGAPEGGAGSNKVGVYYNYCAASAGSYCYSSSSGFGNATEDLCPKGWHMPTSNSSGEYKTLYDKYSSSSEGQVDAFKNTLSTPLSGNFSGGLADYQGSYGYFWASTRFTASSMYQLSVGTNSIAPSSSIGRGNSRSLRCVKSAS